MRHSRLGLLIGLFSTIVHGVLLVFFASDLIQLRFMLKEDDDAALTSRWVIGIDVFFFVLEITLCIASILLVIGVKKERPQYLAPWIYLTVIFIVVHLLDLMRYSSYLEHHHVDFTIILKILPIVLLAVLWHPIFKLWRKFLAARKSPQSQEFSDTNLQQGPTNCPPGNDNDVKSPMLYPNLGTAVSHQSASEGLLEKPSLYPNLV